MLNLKLVQLHNPIVRTIGKGGRKHSFENIPQVLKKYLVSLQPNCNKKYFKQIKYFLVDFSRFINDQVFHQPDIKDFDLSLVTAEHVAAFKQTMLQRKSSKSVTNQMHHIKKFLKSIEVNLPPIGPKVMLEFVDYLKNIKKFSQTENNLKHLNLLNEFLEDNYKEINISHNFDFCEIELSHLIAFEKYQLSKVATKKIKKVYVYNILRSVKMFFQYLRRKGHSDVRYKPERFLQRGKERANEYVEPEDIQQMIKTFFNPLPKNINIAYRNLAIFLIILNTGCRALEVCNLKVSDILSTESALLLNSKKSGQRKLKIDKEVMKYIEIYFQLRNSFNPKNDSLFLSYYGETLKSKTINGIFRMINLKTFDNMINSPKVFRHTYITNALENNDIKKVAAAAGHKHAVSTDYYRYRTINRLIKNTENHDPIKKFSKEFNYGTTKDSL